MVWMNDDRQTDSVALAAESNDTPQAPLKAGAVLADRYEIRRLLGSGGYAHVYAAWDRTLRRELAIKVLRGERISESVLRRLRREVLVAQKTRHPNLLRIYDFGQTGEHVFITMELVRGSSLVERISAAPLEIEDSIRIARDLLDALHELHVSGIVHRDIKPGNILIDEAGAVRLADFGLVREIESDETRATATDAVLGTLRFVSPEQALGLEIDGRSDLYALGIVLYEMLTQRGPFESTSSLGTLLAHLNRKAPDIRTLRNDVPRWLANVIARLLERNRVYRYPSASSVIDDLEAHRARIAPARLRRMALSVALLATLVSVTFVSMRPRPRLDRIFVEANQPARAVDENGETIWMRDDITSNESTVFVRTHEGRRVATFLSRPRTGPIIGIPRELSFLDAETGEVTGSVTLPEPYINFDDLPKNFVLGGVFAADIEGDGFDEVIINWLHYPYYPSFALLHSPTTGLTQFIFAASGHHRAGWTADVDGDGRKEIVLTGINNRFGWHTAVAAVRITASDAVPLGTPQASGLLSSPDADNFSNEQLSNDRLAFYTLLPEGVVAFDAVSVDEPGRLIRVGLADGRTFAVTFDGFLEEDRSTVAPDARNDYRRQAYRLLRQSKVEAALERNASGLALAEEAVSFAELAADSILTEWTRLVVAGRLVENGRYDDARIAYEALAATPDRLRSVSWDAGHHLHVAGRLDDAVEWYAHGLAATGSVNTGRSRYQYMEGIALALAEAARGDELRRLAATWRDAFGNDQFISHFEAFAHWIDKKPFVWEPTHVAGQGPGLQRYWEYEFRVAGGIDAAALLEELDAEVVPLDVPAALTSSLRGELFAALGRGDEAIESARLAWDRTRNTNRDDLVTRAHARIITERYIQLAETRGLKDEARRARLGMIR